MRFASALLVLLAPLVWGDCTNNPVWSRTCADLTSLTPPVAVPTFLTSGRSRTAAESFVDREIIKFTGGTCATSTCSITQLKGEATDACWAAALKLLCFHAAAPLATVETSQCAGSTAAAPMISECSDVFTACSATVSQSNLVIDSRTYCAGYKCDVDDAAACGAQTVPTNGTCVAPFAEHPPRCVCEEGQIGSECGSPSIACQTSNPAYECTGHGVCDRFQGTCTCLLDFEGGDCAAVSCLKSGDSSITSPCNGHGICHPVGVCQCDAGWIGAECTINITDEGMTSGEFAGAVIGGLIFSFIFCGITGYLFWNSTD